MNLAQRIYGRHLLSTLISNGVLKIEAPHLILVNPKNKKVSVLKKLCLKFKKT